ncbi:probable Bax inhibitor 1 [Lytechinus pictus]|uniref:probable Bax inhibitor 1 n=1 Tax=Lytechinus pictus TaxID=7653 RepID=UPI00240D5354|nr:probable Bax inhibitor 1 [Lytechinus pictus]
MDFLSGNRKIEWNALFQFSQLTKDCQSHLKRVYSCLAMCMMAAAVGSYVNAVLHILQGQFLTTIATLGLFFWLRSIPQTVENQGKRLSILLGFAFCVGVSTGPLLTVVAEIDPSIITTAFMATTVVFVCFSLAALMSQQRTMLFLAGPLMSGLSMMMIMSLVNIFFRSAMVFQFGLYIGVVIFSGFILFDTQLIVEKHLRGDRDFIMHSVDLFLDFVNLFRHILILLAQNNENKNRRNRKK